MRFLFFTFTLICSFQTLLGFSQADSLKFWVSKNLPFQTIEDFNSDDFDYLLRIADYYKNNETDSAAFFNNLALLWANSNNDEFRKAKALEQSVRIYYIKGNYPKSLALANELLELSRAIDYKAGMAEAYRALGLQAFNEKQYQKCIELNNDALKIWYSIADSMSTARNYLNIAIAQESLKQYNTAINSLQLGIEVAKSYDYWELLQMLYSRAGDVYALKQQFDSALYFYDLVLNNEEKATNWEYSFVHSGKAKVYNELNQYQLAILHADTAISFAKKAGALWDHFRAVEAKAKAYEIMGDYQKVLQLQKKLNMLSDSLVNQSSQQQINALKFEQLELEKDYLRNQNTLIKSKSDRNLMFMLFFVLLLIILTTALFYILRASRQKRIFSENLEKKNSEIAKQNVLIAKQNRQLEEINQTKNQLFSVLSHDLRNPIGSLKQLLQLSQEGLLSESELKDLLKSMHENVVKTAAMLDNMLAWAKSQLEGVNPKLQKVKADALMEEVIQLYNFKAESKEIMINHNVSVHKEVTVDPNHLKIIGQNILANAIKFTPKKGQISISYELAKDYLQIHFKDSGAGMDKKTIDKLINNPSINSTTKGTENEQGSGLGLLLVKQYLTYNHGFMEIISEREKGTEFIISLPLHKEV